YRPSPPSPKLLRGVPFPGRGYSAVAQTSSCLHPFLGARADPVAVASQCGFDPGEVDLGIRVDRQQIVGKWAIAQRLNVACAKSKFSGLLALSVAENRNI